MHTSHHLDTIPHTLPNDARVRIWKTTGDQYELLAEQAPVPLEQYDGNPKFHPITIDTDRRYQSMIGFGGAMTDSTAYNIWHRLDAKQREKLMRELFRPTDGIGISCLRLPMGASDFANSYYTYDDVPKGQTDPDLNYFSIAHDKEYIIPLLQHALELNPHIQIIASPWSPPAWMKTSDSLIGGSLKPEYYTSYAQYFVRFIDAYEQAGIPIFGITVQNEPLYTPAHYPGMSMTATEQTEFIRDHLGPALRQASLSTKVIAYDHNWDNISYPSSVLSDPEANKYVDGISWHAYAGSPESQSPVRAKFPDKNHYFTEVTASVGGDFAADLKWHMHFIQIGAIRNWARCSVYWNLMLDENGSPFNAGQGSTNVRGVMTINSTDATIIRNAEYYALAHSSRFVQSGAIRIYSDDYGNGWVESVAYQNPDGSKVLVVLCSAKTAQSFKVIDDNTSFSYTLQPGDVATFIW